MNRFAICFLFMFCSIIEVRADSEAVVIEVRKNTNLSKKDKVFKNFFISGGENFGLKPGLHVDIMRRLPVHDPLRNASIGDFRIKVGTVEIIHSEEKISVARLVSYDSMEKRPLLDYEAIMVGDRLDLASVRAAPAPEAQTASANTLDGENVALLKTQTKAERLIQEGERSLATLEMRTKAQEAATARASAKTKRVARAPASVGGKAAVKPASKKAGVKSQRVGKTTLKKK